MRTQYVREYIQSDDYIMEYRRLLLFLVKRQLSSNWYGTRPFKNKFFLKDELTGS